MDVRFEEIPRDLVDTAMEKFRVQILDAIEKSGSETTYDIIRAQLLLGSIKMYYAVLPVNGTEKLGGFIMTEVNPGASGAWIGIPWGWGEPKYFRKIDLFSLAMENLKETCRQMGFRGIRMLSARKGMYRRAKALGFKPRFVEYVLEVSPEAKVSPEANEE